MKLRNVRRCGTCSVKTMHVDCACGSRKMCFVALRVNRQLWVLCPLPMSFAFFLLFRVRWRLRRCCSLTVNTS